MGHVAMRYRAIWAFKKQVRIKKRHVLHVVVQPALPVVFMDPPQCTARGLEIDVHVEIARAYGSWRKSACDYPR